MRHSVGTYKSMVNTLVLKLCFFVTIFSTVLCFACPVFADNFVSGPYLSIEGQIGKVDGLLTSQGTIATSPAENNWQQGLTPSDMYGAQVDVGWRFKGEAGGYHRVSLVYSGSLIDEDLTNNYYGAVLVEGSTDGNPRGEINVCPSDDGSPCSYFEYTARRELHELRPEVMFGKTGFSDSFIWLGVQPFFGVVSESSKAALRSGLGIQSEWDSWFVGGLLAAEVEKPVSEKLKIICSLGVGPYIFNTDSRVEGNSFGAVQNDSKDQSGLRAQVGLGTEFSVNPNLSLGLFGRMDYWSDLASIKGYKDSGTRCDRLPDKTLVCEPPRVENEEYQISFDSAVTFSAGVKLTYRFGQ